MVAEKNSYTLKDENKSLAFTLARTRNPDRITLHFDKSFFLDLPTQVVEGHGLPTVDAISSRLPEEYKRVIFAPIRSVVSDAATQHSKKFKDRAEDFYPQCAYRLDADGLTVFIPTPPFQQLRRLVSKVLLISSDVLSNFDATMHRSPETNLGSLLETMIASTRTERKRGAIEAGDTSVTYGPEDLPTIYETFSMSVGGIFDKSTISSSQVRALFVVCKEHRENSNADVSALRQRIGTIVGMLPEEIHDRRMDALMELERKHADIMQRYRPAHQAGGLSL